MNRREYIHSELMDHNDHADNIRTSINLIYFHYIYTYKEMEKKNYGHHIQEVLRE